MANPNPSNKFKPGNTLGTGGLTKEARAERDRGNAILINPANTADWAEAYMTCVREKVTPVLLDYGNRLLGKPPDKVEHSGPGGESLGLSKDVRLKYLDGLLALTKGKP